MTEEKGQAAAATVNPPPSAPLGSAPSAEREERALVRIERGDTALEIAARASGDDVDLSRINRRCVRLASDVRPLSGPGAAAVRSAARKLVLALELYEQNQRRLAVEVLRSDADS